VGKLETFVGGFPRQTTRASHRGALCPFQKPLGRTGRSSLYRHVVDVVLGTTRAAPSRLVVRSTFAASLYSRLVRFELSSSSSGGEGSSELGGGVPAIDHESISPVL
jgi:hypothetical protein